MQIDGSRILDNHINMSLLVIPAMGTMATSGSLAEIMWLAISLTLYHEIIDNKN